MILLLKQNGSMLIKMLQWAEAWLVTFNPNNTESLIISRKINKRLHPSLYMNNQQVLEVDCHKHLGLYLSNNGSWHQQINFILERAWCKINIMRKLKFKFDRKSHEIIYTAFIISILEYGDYILDNCAQYEKNNEIEKDQLEAAGTATGTTQLISINTLTLENEEKITNSHYSLKLAQMFLHLTFPPQCLNLLITDPATTYSQGRSGLPRKFDADLW